MPRKRKKVAKSAVRKKQQPKKQTQSASPATLQRLEKALTEAPVHLGNQLKKESANLKQQTLKIKTTISKIESQIKKLEKSVAAAEKLNTATGRKRLKAAKKALNDTKKDLALSNKLYKETTTLLEATDLKLSKLASMRKTLIKFEKDWKTEVRERAEKTKKAAEAKAKLAAEKAKKAAEAKARKAAEKAKKAAEAKAKLAAKKTNTKVAAKPKLTKAAKAVAEQPTLTVIEQSKDDDSFDRVADELKEMLIEENKQASS